MIDKKFIARMEHELEVNVNKGHWTTWFPSEMQLIAEVIHHTGKLANALYSGNKYLVAEYAADIANLAEKAFVLYGS